jgi:acylphosphatase
MAAVARRFFFSGRVQGVGFRYKTTDFATEMRLNGFVRNLIDGRVELVVEGDEAHIRALIESLQNHFHGYVTDIEEHDAPFEGRSRFDLLR